MSFLMMRETYSLDLEIEQADLPSPVRLRIAVKNYVEDGEGFPFLCSELDKVLAEGLGWF